MKKTLLLTTVVASLVLSACQNETEKKHLIFNNFEGLDGWGGINNPSLNKENAFSGQYSIKIDNNVEYSLTYIKPVSELFGGAIPNKVKVEAKLFKSSENSNAKIVFSINDSETNQSVLWESINLSELSKSGSWETVSKEFTIPKNIPLKSTLGIYLWRGDSQDAVFLDDLSLDVLE